MPCPSPGDLLDPGIKPTSLMSPASAVGLFTTSATWEAQNGVIQFISKGVLSVKENALGQVHSTVPGAGQKFHKR